MINLPDLQREYPTVTPRKDRTCQHIRLDPVLDKSVRHCRKTNTPEQRVVAKDTGDPGRSTSLQTAKICTA